MDFELSVFPYSALNWTENHTAYLIKSGSCFLFFQFNNGVFLLTHTTLNG